MAGEAQRWQLPSGAAGPTGSDEDRLFLSARLALFGKVMFGLGLFFFVMNTAVGLLLMPPGMWALHLYTLSTLLHVISAAVSGAQWLVCRTARLTIPQLQAIDTVVLACVMSLYGAMVVAVPGGAEWEQCLVIALVTLSVVITRAIVVPSTMRRTLLTSVLACLPTLVATYLIVRAKPMLDQPWTVAVATSYVATWCFAAVAIASVASRVIYGLRRQVREAAQLGQYTLEEKIGEGGMGAVYRARHALLRRPTAVKLLPKERAGEQELARFEREVQLTSSLTHPNTIGIFDYGHTPDGVFYYAMEYLDGITLEDLVSVDGRQPAARVAHILRQIAGALSEAHGISLIHRDVKPANVMLCARGGVFDHVKVLDFGLVKDMGHGPDTSLSTTGMLIGTPLYLAPEAIIAADGIDARADLYALGAVGYFLLTGTPPFTGASLLEICAHHLHSQPERPSQRAGATVPASLEELVLRCLAKQPKDRPRSAAEVLRTLDAIDVASWTQDDARLWWDEAAQAVRDSVRARREQESGSIAVGATVCVDMMRRDDHAVSSAGSGRRSDPGQSVSRAVGAARRDPDASPR